MSRAYSMLTNKLLHTYHMVIESFFVCFDGCNWLFCSYINPALYSACSPLPNPASTLSEAVCKRSKVATAGTAPAQLQS